MSIPLYPKDWELVRDALEDASQYWSERIGRFGISKDEAAKKRVEEYRELLERFEGKGIE